MPPLLLAALLAAPPDGTAAGSKQMAAFRLPPGLKAELFAADPMVASPVAIALDERNRVYLAEEYRFNQGAEENRTRPFFLDDDLQIRTLDDRLAMYRKWADRFPGGMGWFTKHADQVRRLEDTRGTGRADKATVFSGGYNGPLDGLAAGVMATDGTVYFTCIPSLYALRDTDGDGVADKKETILTGFGVNCAFLGHDLHGLCWGPDGRLYFSVGDRGFHVTTKEGTTLSGPRTGAVFRCEPDGRNLEVVHRGLRNPQELAFDQFGNLFADDNNCDKGDDARLVYVVDGGESGWNMAYQTIPAPYTAGPWFAERLWHLPHAGQAAYIVPPVGKIGTGPSGFLFTSGTSLPERYRNAFLMCNYTGNGGIEAFRVKPAGAGFVIEDYHDFLKPVRATDCEFGYDGKLYVADFVDLKWDGGSAGGRVYTVFDPAKLADPVVAQTKALFAEGFSKRSAGELADLLKHPDQRVRLRAQFALAVKGPSSAEAFAGVAKGGDRLARLHAVWGLGQLLRKGAIGGDVLVSLLADADAEVRAQAAKVLGDAAHAPAAAKLLPLLADAELRVRFFAAQALGRLKHTPAVGPLFELLRANADADPFLRAAAVIALARIGAADEVAARSADPSAAVRMAVVLVQRRLGDRRIAAFLSDADPLVRTEAARAVHDLAMDDLLPQLAAVLPTLTRTQLPDADPLARRAISANYRLGGAEHAKAVLAAATSAPLSSAVRAEAIAALREWASPPPRDRVTGFWRPLPARDVAVVRQVVAAGLADLLAGTAGPLQADAVSLVAAVGVEADTAAFAGWVADVSRPANARVAALRLLADRRAKVTPAAVTAAIKDSSPLLRAAARDVLAAADPAAGLRSVVGVLADGSAAIAERQQAVSTLARMKSEEAAAVLDGWAGMLAAGAVPAELRLDVQDALKAAPSAVRDQLRAKWEAAEPKDPVGKFRNSLTGGDADRGREVFFNHTAAQCVRCHTVRGVGGTAGPDLTTLAARYPGRVREHALESLMLPSAKLADGYAAVTLTLADGRVVGGVVVSETKAAVTLRTPDGKTMTVPAADIEGRTVAPSAMPSVERTLTPREVRDLIEFLASLR
jgi:quinoprotein glucose dehydrogenase